MLDRNSGVDERREAPRRKVSPLEFAELVSVSRMTVYRMLREEQLPGAVKVRGQWRIPVDALES